MLSLPHSVVTKENLKKDYATFQDIKPGTFIISDFRFSDFSHPLVFNDYESFIEKVDKVTSRKSENENPLIVAVTSLEKKVLVDLFEKRFFLVNLSFLSGESCWSFVFIHAPSCEKLSRFFEDPQTRQNDRYSKNLFKFADTVVPLYENEKIIENGLMMMESVWQNSTGNIEDMYFVGVGIEQMGYREGVLFSSARPSIQIEKNL